MEFLDQYFDKGLEHFLITSIIIIVLTIFINRLLTYLFNRVNKKLAIKKIDNHLLLKMIKIGINICAVYAIASLIVPFQKFSTTILAGSSIVVVMLGLAAQEATSNIIGGLFLSVFKPFDIGDLIYLKNIDVVGKVENINLRHTIITTFSNNRIIIPNAKLNSEIIENRNLIDEKVVNYLWVTIGYNSDVDLAISCIKQIVLNHELTVDKESMNVVVSDLTNLGVVLKISMTSLNVNTGYTLMCDVRYQIIKSFKEKGISIPYNSVQVVYEKSN